MTYQLTIHLFEPNMLTVHSWYSILHIGWGFYRGGMPTTSLNHLTYNPVSKSYVYPSVVGLRISGHHDTFRLDPQRGYLLLVTTCGFGRSFSTGPTSFKQAPDWDSSKLGNPGVEFGLLGTTYIGGLHNLHMKGELLDDHHAPTGRSLRHDTLTGNHNLNALPDRHVNGFIWETAHDWLWCQIPY